MVSTDTILTLIQFVALVLPAIGIYLQILISLTSPETSSIGTQATFHQVRLSIMFLIAGGLLLFGELLLVGFSICGPICQIMFVSSVVLLACALILFATSVVYWPHALWAETTIQWGLMSIWHRLASFPHKVDIEILQYLQQQGISTPSKYQKERSPICGIGYVKKRFEKLEKYDLIEKKAENEFELTELGEKYTDSDADTD